MDIAGKRRLFDGNCPLDRLSARLNLLGTYLVCTVTLSC